MQSNSKGRSEIRTSSSINLAFAVVMLASYFFTFSSFRDASTIKIAAMIGLGMIYLAVGIYGFGYCMHSEDERLRILYFLIQIPLGGLIVYLSKGTGLNALLLLPLAGQSAVLLDPTWMYLTNGAILSVYILSASILGTTIEGLWGGLSSFLPGQLFVVVFTQMAVGEEKARVEVERLLHELADANQHLREYMTQLEDLTITKERNRLAREIHDGLGHYLTTIYMQIQAAKAVFLKDPAKAREALETAQELTQEALVDVRQSVAALRSTVDLSETLTEKIEDLLKTTLLACITSEFSLIGTPRHSNPQVQLTLYRAVQEGVNNSCKHSNAEHLWVVLDYSDTHEILLSVSDDGIGSDNLEGGFGIIGLQERVKILNGSISISTAKDQGFKFILRLPG